MTDNPPARVTMRANKRPERKISLTSNVTPERLADARDWALACEDVIDRYVRDARDPDALDSLGSSYSEVRYFLSKGEALWNDLSAALDQGVTVFCWGVSHTCHFAVLLSSLSRIDATVEAGRIPLFLRAGFPTATAEAVDLFVQSLSRLSLPRPATYISMVTAELSRAATGRVLPPHTVTLEAEPVRAAAARFVRRKMPQGKAKQQRRCYERDHTWLRWEEKEGLVPSEIRDRHNREHPTEKIGSGAPGIDLVKKALDRARCDKK